MLTPRQQEVLIHLSNGLRAKQIAYLIGTTYRTAKFHCESVVDRLGAKSQAHAVAIALRKGLIE